MTKFKILSMLVLSICVALFSSCNEEEDSLAPFTVNFSSSTSSLSASSPESEIKIIFSRPSTVSGNVMLNYSSDELKYGKDANFHTSITPESNSLIIPFTVGDQDISFKVMIGDAVDLTKDATLMLTIAADATTTDYQVGETGQISVVFSENFISDGASLEMSAGGPSFDQRAYVDLSKALSTSVPVDNFDLGFHSGAGFYVSLNSSAYIMARPLDKTDLTKVTSADTTFI